MKARFINAKWKKGESDIVHGYKGGSHPKGNYTGGNGTFRVMEPAEVILKFMTEEGEQIAFNALPLIKRNTEWKRMSDKRLEKLENALIDVNWEVNDNGYINNLDSIIAKLK